MKYIIDALLLILVINIISTLETKCHPQCSWKCDDPHCPAICDPVCEPPKCHTSCAEPKNAICDVKCEKPECEIKCPDKGCEGLDCPKCVTVCKQPHCVTHCQAPKPECEPVCEEPNCDWKCHKPNCPKPKCELVCENPNCAPKVECCPCNTGLPVINPGLPFFKETEKEQRCCQCPTAANLMRFKGIEADNPHDFRVQDRTQFIDNQDHFVKIEKSSSVNVYPSPMPIETPTLNGKGIHTTEYFDAKKEAINIDKIYKENGGNPLLINP